MLSVYQTKPEGRYGIPSADLILFNLTSTVGYDFRTKLPRFVLELSNKFLATKRVERIDAFRADLRVPEIFRSTLEDYKGTGCDRGHQIPSADEVYCDLASSQTFLLSNICPQISSFNRGIWKKLEKYVRNLGAFQLYVITGPVFYPDQPTSYTERPDKQRGLPIAHAFFKSYLIESRTGKFSMRSYVIPHNEDISASESLDQFIVPTRHVEQLTGLLFWHALIDRGINEMKEKK